MTGAELLLWLQELSPEELDMEVMAHADFFGEGTYAGARAEVKYVKTPWMGSGESGTYIIIESED